MDNNEIRKEVREMRNNGASEKKIAKALGFKNFFDFRKFMSKIEQERIDYVGYHSYKY